MGGRRAHPIHRDWYWEHDDEYGVWKSLDWPSVRRGRQVYTEVFAPCHSLGKLTFMHFQAFMTREEIKQLASTYEISDENEPDSTGAIVPRPGKPTDTVPAPYPNQRAAQYANGGAEPPDLQTAPFGKEGGCDYIFSLVTGYNWGNGELLPVPPFAPEVKAGAYWNPYMKGGVIAMPPPLSDGLLEFEDGTPATISQMAKDVCNFLRWTSETEYDDRRIYFWKWISTILIANVLFFHYAQKNLSYKIYMRNSYRYWKKPY